MKKALLGAGGMARELEWLTDIRYETTQPFNPDYEYIIGVGYPETKKAIIEKVPLSIKLSKPAINQAAFIGKNVYIGHGSVVCPFAVINVNVSIGILSAIYNNVTIGHDCKIGDLFHASPGAVISGNVTIGDCVFMGANSCIKEKITICNDVIIGAGAVVVKNITEPGKYAGNPAVKL